MYIRGLFLHMPLDTWKQTGTKQSEDAELASKAAHCQFSECLILVTVQRMPPEHPEPQLSWLGLTYLFQTDAIYRLSLKPPLAHTTEIAKDAYQLVAKVDWIKSNRYLSGVKFPSTAKTNFTGVSKVLWLQAEYKPL